MTIDIRKKDQDMQDNEQANIQALTKVCFITVDGKAFIRRETYNQTYNAQLDVTTIWQCRTVWSVDTLCNKDNSVVDLNDTTNAMLFSEEITGWYDSEPTTEDLLKFYNKNQALHIYSASGLTEEEVESIVNSEPDNAH